MVILNDKLLYYCVMKNMGLYNVTPDMYGNVSFMFPIISFNISKKKRSSTGFQSQPQYVCAIWDCMKNRSRHVINVNQF